MFNAIYEFLKGWVILYDADWSFMDVRYAWGLWQKFRVVLQMHV